MYCNLNNKTFYLIVFIGLITSCTNDKSKAHHNYTTKIEEHLYLENYWVSKGMAGVFTNRYFTDSTTFRVFVGICDESEDESYKAQIQGDSIIIDRMGWKGVKINDTTHKI